MGLFDFFKNKNAAASTDPSENRIEIVLRKAAKEPAYRTEFYQLLLSEKLVVLTDKVGTPGIQTLETNATVNMVTLSDGKIPVFTSQARIFDKQVIKSEVSIMEMKGADLFNLAKGTTFMLNPYSDYGKELLPGEIAQMLDGTILTANHREIKYEKATQIQLGQPAIYPTEAIKSLQILFAQKPNVIRAYMAWMYDASSGQPPHLLFGLEVDGDMREITHEAGFTATQVLQKDEIVDFIQVGSGGNLDDYFLSETKPFYERGK